MNTSISTLFLPEPAQWGLRGDPYLWREMAGRFQGVPLPKSSSELRSAIEEAFLELAGHPVSYGRDFRVVRHAHGGMSSGCISTEFWRERGVPLLVFRFEAMRRPQ